MPLIKVKSVNWEKVDKLLDQASVPLGTKANMDLKKAGFAFPGAVLHISCGGEVLYHKAAGCRSVHPEVSELQKEMVYDVSSLTKVVVTTSLAMYLVERGLLDVDRRLSHVFQTFSIHGKERMTVRDLLMHTSGYAAYAPFYKRIAKSDDVERCGFMSTRGASESVCQEIFRMRLENIPGKVAKYSDIGFILLGHVIEQVSGMSLRRLAEREIFSRLKMHSSGFIDLSELKRKAVVPVNDAIAPTNICSWRRRLICGEVQDENAWAMGGIAGHAGLFSTAADLDIFCQEMINCYHGRGTLFDKNLVHRFWTKDERVEGSSWTMGWDTPTPGASQSGQYFSQKAVGHLGFTGCSLWIDPERELSVILLSNRVHPSTENELIKKFRPQVHDLVMEALGFV